MHLISDLHLILEVAQVGTFSRVNES